MLIDAQAKERWNFDFENEVPLSGRYEWVKLDRDGNEISETSEQLRNEICDSREEQSEEAKVDTEEREWRSDGLSTRWQEKRDEEEREEMDRMGCPRRDII